MSRMRLADLTAIYKVKDIMNEAGYSETQYSVIDGYPNFVDLDTEIAFPIITVELDNVFGRNVELGSKQWPAFRISIDVFARSDAQRDDLSYMIWRALNETDFTFYDFNSGFPTAIGNYTGIDTIGTIYFDKMTIAVLSPGDFTSTEGEKHHALVDGFLYLPNH